MKFKWPLCLVYNEKSKAMHIWSFWNVVKGQVVGICFKHKMDCEKKQTCYVPFGVLFFAQAFIKECLQTTCSQPKLCASIPISDSSVQVILSYLLPHWKHLSYSENILTKIAHKYGYEYSFLLIPSCIINLCIEVKFELQHLSGDSNFGLFTSISKITPHEQFLKEMY